MSRPAIGATAAYGLAQVYAEAPDGSSRDAFIEAGHALLRATRPTAQNLFYALSNEELDVQLERFENIAMIGPVKLFVNVIPGEEDQGIHVEEGNL